MTKKYDRYAVIRLDKDDNGGIPIRVSAVPLLNPSAPRERVITITRRMFKDIENRINRALPTAIDFGFPQGETYTYGVLHGKKLAYTQ